MSDIAYNTLERTGELVLNRITADHEHFRSIFLEATKGYNSMNANQNRKLFLFLTSLLLPVLANKVSNYFIGFREQK
jgi:hypothetical protein